MLASILLQPYINMFNRLLIFLLFQLALLNFVQSQSNLDSMAIPNSDSVVVEDTVIKYVDPLVLAYFNDSVNRKVNSHAIWKFDNSQQFLRQWIQNIYKQHPYYNFKKPNAKKSSDLKIFHGKEILFYVLTGLILLFAIFKLVFAKYLKDLFRLFFRTTLKYNQISELLLQNPLPSLLMNLFFVLSASFYITVILFYLKLSPLENFWQLLLYATAIVSIVYLGKYIILKFSGWLFNFSTATDSYIFIIFIVNKVIAIYVLPFIIIISFSDGQVQQVAFTLSWIGIFGLLVYRFILSYGSMRNLVKVNPFHFLLYLSAFEIAPLLILYKLVLIYI